jgi:hypothetical protein
MEEEYLVVGWDSTNERMENRYFSRKRTVLFFLTMPEYNTVADWVTDDNPSVGQVLELRSYTIIRVE